MSDATDLIRRAKGLEPGAALEALRDGCRQFPSLPLYHACIDLLEDCNETDEAIGTAQAALALYPDDLGLRLKEALLLPVLYDDMEQVGRWRERFSRNLRRLTATLTLDTAEQRAFAIEAIRHHVNFYLGYQGQDDRELQREYGRLVQRVVAAHCGANGLDWLALPREAATQGPRDRIRIGYISRRIATSTSVSKAFGGWILNRDRDRFEVFCYQIGTAPDSSPGELGAASDRFRHLNGDLGSRCEAIRADRLDAAIFLDVGMSPEMNVLASMRFAPVQCAAWGHSVTTGSPNIDYFLSSSLMEPANGAEHYTERLITLPGIGSCYRRPLIPRPVLDTRRVRFGLREDSVVYLCSQSTFKYLPGDDYIFPEIARRVPSAQFVFRLSHPMLAEGFRRRLERSFAGFGLSSAESCIIVPHLTLFDYWALHLTADVYLDSLGWSGFNATLDAIAAGLPVVTLPGRFARGRQSYAILSQIGVTETIARNGGEYVELAARLGNDSAWRQQVVQKMAERQARVYSDMSSVTALESFLMEAVRSEAAKIGKT